MKIADSLRLCAPELTQIVGRLRLRAPPSYNRRQSKALGTCCASQSPKLQDVSGFLQPHDEKSRQSQARCTSPRENWGDVSGSVQPHDASCRQSQALRAPPSRKLRDVSGCLHPHHKFADSLRLWAFSVLSNHQKCGASQALCTPVMKIAGRLRLCAPSLHENCGVPQALCTPMMLSLIHI